MKRFQPSVEEQPASERESEEEQKVVDMVTAPGGVRAAPARDQLDHFIKKCVCVFVGLSVCVLVSLSVCGVVNISLLRLQFCCRCKSLDVLIITDLLKEKLRSESQQVVLVSIDIGSCDAYDNHTPNIT